MTLRYNFNIKLQTAFSWDFWSHNSQVDYFGFVNDRSKAIFSRPVKPLYNSVVEIVETHYHDSIMNN